MSNTRNTLGDLNNHLFEQLERLNDDEMDEETLDKELKRAEGMTKIAEKIIQNGELAFKTMKHMDEYGHNQGGAGACDVGDSQCIGILRACWNLSRIITSSWITGHCQRPWALYSIIP